MVANIASGNGRAASLHAQVRGEAGAPDVLLLHGLFGMGSNLGALARALQDRYRVHQLDLPNHGRSPWLSPMDLGSLAAAVGAYASAVAAGPVAVVGHSLGGKVAMQLALQAPGQVAAIVVADIAPVNYPGTHGPEFAALRAVAAAAPPSRAAARSIMEQHVDDEQVVQFLLLSLARGDDGVYRWRFNVEELEQSYDALRQAPQGPAGSGVPALLIYGTASPYVREDGIAAAHALFRELVVRPIEGAGHWLHAEQPQVFNAAVGGFLDLHAGAAT